MKKAIIIYISTILVLSLLAFGSMWLCHYQKTIEVTTTPKPTQKEELKTPEPTEKTEHITLLDRLYTDTDTFVQYDIPEELSVIKNAKTGHEILVPTKYKNELNYFTQQPDVTMELEPEWFTIEIKTDEVPPGKTWKEMAHRPMGGIGGEHSTTTTLFGTNIGYAYKNAGFGFNNQWQNKHTNTTISIPNDAKTSFVVINLFARTENYDTHYELVEEIAKSITWSNTNNWFTHCTTTPEAGNNQKTLTFESNQGFKLSYPSDWYVCETDNLSEYSLRLVSQKTMSDIHNGTVHPETSDFTLNLYLSVEEEPENLLNRYNASTVEELVDRNIMMTKIGSTTLDDRTGMEIIHGGGEYYNILITDEEERLFKFHFWQFSEKEKMTKTQKEILDSFEFTN